MATKVMNHAELAELAELAGLLQRDFGSNFEPKEAGRLKTRMLKTLLAALPEHNIEQINRAFDETTRTLRANVDWTRFLCVILGQLPGWWTKLTNKPGFNTSTMLLLTDGSVMVQEQGGLRWKKLTPDRKSVV